LRFIQFG